MKYLLDKGSHSVYALQYHLVQCIKYRRKVFVSEDIVALLKTKIHEISETYDVDVLNIEADLYHFHMLFKAKPICDLPNYINTVKTITSREIRRIHPEVKKLLWQDKFWSGSYFLATTGQVTLKMLKKYVEQQKKGRVNATNTED